MAIISISGKAGSGKDTVGKIIQYLTAANKSNKCLGLLKLGDDIKGYHNSNWQIKKWATALRKVSAILLGMDEEFLYTEEFKQMVLPECWDKILSNEIQKNEIIPMTGRDFLQKLGTDAIRNGLHENAWVNALMSEYKNDPIQRQFVGGQDTYYVNNYPNWIITDTRFPNELAAVKERGGITIRINRNNPSIETLTQQDVVNAFTELRHTRHPSETALDNAQFDYVVDNNGTIEELSDKLLTILKSTNYGHISD